MYVSGCSLGIDLKSKPILYNYRKSLRSVLGLYREILVDVLEKNKIRENKLFSPENLENLGEVTFCKRIRMLIGSCKSFLFFLSKKVIFGQTREIFAQSRRDVVF